MDILAFKMSESLGIAICCPPFSVAVELIIEAIIAAGFIVVIGLLSR